MLTDLHQAHERLLAALDELEVLTAAPRPDSGALAGVRLKLSRASGQRRRLVDEACVHLLETAPQGDAQAIRALRQEMTAMQSASSRHVGAWSIGRVVEDWDGYRAASAVMRAAMRERIAAEKRLLYPRLQRPKA